MTTKHLINKAKCYRLKPASLGKTSSDYNLNKALQLADHLEDKGEYVFYEETAYLMASPKNAERLNQAINEAES